MSCSKCMFYVSGSQIEARDAKGSMAFFFFFRFCNSGTHIPTLPKLPYIVFILIAIGLFDKSLELKKCNPNLNNAETSRPVDNVIWI